MITLVQVEMLQVLRMVKLKSQGNIIHQWSQLYNTTPIVKIFTEQLWGWDLA
jgi:hypothetical protein